MATNNHHLPRCRLARGGVGVVSAGGASKAQAALARILAVISTTVPPSLTAAPLKSTAAFGNHHRDSQAAGFDLNLRLGVEIEGDEKKGGDQDSSLVIDPFATTAAGSVGLSNGSISPAESVAGDARTATERSSEGECDPSEKQEEVVGKSDDDDEYSEDEEEKEEIISEMSNNDNIVVAVGRGEISKSRENGSKREEGNYLDLLLEAVQHELVVAPAEKAEIKTETMPTKEKASVGTNYDNNSPPPPPSKKRVRSSLKWTSAVDFLAEEEAAPLVRSKRGRNQTLPSRYRDSVLEPWAKPPTVNRHATARTRTRTTKTPPPPPR